MPQFPVTLPMPLVDGLQYGASDNVIRSPNGLRTRRRSTWAPVPVSVRLALTRPELQIINDFYDITCQEVMPFKWVEFRDPAFAPAVYKFAERPTQGPRRTSLRWDVSVQLMLLTRPNGTFPLDFYDSAVWPTT